MEFAFEIAGDDAFRLRLCKWDRRRPMDACRLRNRGLARAGDSNGGRAPTIPVGTLTLSIYISSCSGGEIYRTARGRTSRKTN